MHQLFDRVIKTISYRVYHTKKQEKYSQSYDIYIYIYVYMYVHENVYVHEFLPITERLKVK